MENTPQVGANAEDFPPDSENLPQVGADSELIIVQLAKDNARISRMSI